MNPRIAAVLRRVAPHALAIAAFVVATVILRGWPIGDRALLNPDEAELMAQARAALHSPVPFSTWTMGTTGPVWPLFLAGLGSLGLPLTLTFAHLLSAVLVGLMGYFVFLSMRRSFGAVTGTLFTVCWWLPIAMVFPAGGRTDFAALTTEMLPATLLLAAAAIPPAWLLTRRMPFAISGLLCGLAVGAKYQVLPLVAGLLIVQLLHAAPGLKVKVVRALWWVAGFMVPMVALALAVVLSPTTSSPLVKQNLGFLGSYVGGLTFSAKVDNTITLMSSERLLIPAAIVILWMAALSSRRIALARGLMIALGLFAILVGGTGFGHYLLLVFAAFAIALALPVRQGIEPLRGRRTKIVAVVSVGVLAVAGGLIGASAGKLVLTSPRVVAGSLSASSVQRESSMTAVCPVGSRVMVWGWAAELYVNYSWSNSVPFFNTFGIAAHPAIRDADAPYVSRAIDDSDCIIDAVGAPFFGAGSSDSIRRVYPEFVARIDDQYRVAPHALACDACTVYVRNGN